jgi:hypothetical protein
MKSTTVYFLSALLAVASPLQSLAAAKPRLAMTPLESQALISSAQNAMMALDRYFSLQIPQESAKSQQNFFLLEARKVFNSLALDRTLMNSFWGLGHKMELRDHARVARSVRIAMAQLHSNHRISPQDLQNQLKLGALKQALHQSQGSVEFKSNIAYALTVLTVSSLALSRSSMSRPTKGPNIALIAEMRERASRIFRNIAGNLPMPAETKNVNLTIVGFCLSDVANTRVEQDLNLI